MAIGQWFSIVCAAALVASPALATTMISETPVQGRVAPELAVAPDLVAARNLSVPQGLDAAQVGQEAAAGGLSTLETAVMLLGSLVFSAVLLGRKPD